VSARVAGPPEPAWRPVRRRPRPRESGRRANSQKASTRPAAV